MSLYAQEQGCSGGEWNPASAGGCLLSGFRLHEHSCSACQRLLHGLGFFAIHQCVVRIFRRRVTLDGLSVLAASTCEQRRESKARKSRQGAPRGDTGLLRFSAERYGHARAIAAIAERGRAQTHPSAAITNVVVRMNTPPERIPVADGVVVRLARHFV